MAEGAHPSVCRAKPQIAAGIRICQKTESRNIVPIVPFRDIVFHLPAVCHITMPANSQIIFSIPNTGHRLIQRFLQQPGIDALGNTGNGTVFRDIGAINAHHTLGRQIIWRAVQHINGIGADGACRLSALLQWIGGLVIGIQLEGAQILLGILSIGFQHNLGIILPDISDDIRCIRADFGIPGIREIGRVI